MKQIINKIKNWFRLPTPKELGVSDSNALGCRDFTPYQDGFTWEDFDELLKLKHPVKFWLLDTAPEKYWWPIKHKIEHMWYWLQCHTMPWKYNYYKINLSKVDKTHWRSYGYIDPCETLKLCAWYCLIRYIEDCKPTDVASWATEEEIENDVGLKAQKAQFDEAVFLYNWWTILRHDEDKIVHAAYKKHCAMEPALESKEEYDLVTREWLDLAQQQENKDEEMFLRVCKLRQSLWT